MPAILLEEHHDGWIGKAGKEILVSVPADRIKAWPINATVNSPKIMTLILSCRSSLNPWRDRKIFRNCCEVNSRNVAGREHVWRFAKQSDDGGTVSVLVSGMCSLPAAASTSLQSWPPSWLALPAMSPEFFLY